jgi:hypothetical protein
MASKKQKAADSPAFASRPAAEGSAVSFTIHDQEVTLEAAEGPDGWAITPHNEDEARALEGMSDAALNPPPPDAAEESVQAPEGGENPDPDQEVSAGNDDAGAPGQEDQA